MTYNKKETDCKEILEDLFPGYIFNKVRLPSFKNPETGRSLELDLYNSDLKIALEYNGPQHYMQFAKYHRKEGDFEKQVVRDIFKEEYCRINNIVLIEVPNLSKYSDIKEYIIKFLNANNIHCEKKIIDSKKMQGKVCSKCGEEKSIEDFHIDKGKKDGRRNECRSCRKDISKSSRSVKKVEKHEVVPDLSEEEKFEKQLEEFIKTYKTEYSNKEFLSFVEKKVLKSREGLIHPPTNKFIVSLHKYSEAGCVLEGMKALKSQLLLYLHTVKKISNVDIEVILGPNFEWDENLIVLLPEDIKLTKKEINDFITKGKNTEKYHSINFNIDDEELSRCISESANMMIEYISCYFGKKVETSKIPIKRLLIGNNIIIKWPSIYSIGANDIEYIKKKILECRSCNEL